LVEQNVKIAMDAKIDFFLAVGGGSVIDTTKALALATANNGDYWQFYHGTEPKKMTPVGTIHTISAAGSEMSCGSVIVDDIDTKEKKAFMWDCARPVFAIMNPELTYTVSSYQTRAGIADIFAHTFMRYFWLDDLENSLGDEFAEGLLRTVVKYSPIVLANPLDYEARSELMLCGAYSHNGVTQLGREGAFGGEHALGQPLSAHYDTAHGAELAVMMPAMLKYVIEHGPAQKIARAAQFFVKIFNAPLDLADPNAIAINGLRIFKDWLKYIGMPVTLKELGVGDTDVQECINRCVKSVGGKILGFMEFDERAITEIYHNAAS
jgi:alcohol dehydrogenase YqhD (iron-dependent ADH family)